MIELDSSSQASLCQETELRDNQLVDLDAGSASEPPRVAIDAVKHTSLGMRCILTFAVAVCYKYNLKLT